MVCQYEQQKIASRTRITQAIGPICASPATPVAARTVSAASLGLAIGDRAAYQQLRQGERLSRVAWQKHRDFNGAGVWQTAPPPLSTLSGLLCSWMDAGLAAVSPVRFSRVGAQGLATRADRFIQRRMRLLAEPGE